MTYARDSHGRRAPSNRFAARHDNLKPLPHRPLLSPPPTRNGSTCHTSEERRRTRLPRNLLQATLPRATVACSSCPLQLPRFISLRLRLPVQYLNAAVRSSRDLLSPLSNEEHNAPVRPLQRNLMKRVRMLSPRDATLRNRCDERRNSILSARSGPSVPLGNTSARIVAEVSRFGVG